MRLSPHGLLRVAALPFDALLALAPPATTRLVDVALARSREMEDVREAVEDALYDAVPTLDARGRRTALRLRRLVHTSGHSLIGDDEIGQVTCALGADGRRAMARWVSAQRACAAALTEAEDAWSDEVGRHLRPALTALAQDGFVHRGLLLASPTLVADWLAGPAPRRPTDRPSALESSLLRYVARSAAKTSPFSTFMHQGLVELSDAPVPLPSLADWDRRSWTYVDRGVLFTIHRLAQSQSDDDSACLMINPSLRWNPDGGASVLVPEHFSFGARLLRFGRPVALRLHRVVSDRLGQLPERFSRSDLREALQHAGLAGDAACGLAATLTDRGVVLPMPFTSGTDPHPDVACAVALGEGTLLAEAVTNLAAGAHLLPDASPRDRTRILSAASATLTRLGIEDSLRTRVTPYGEDGVFREPLGTLGEGVSGLVREAAEALRPFAVMTAGYRVLRNAFVDRFGRAGQCSDVEDFVRGVADATRDNSWWIGDPDVVEPPAPDDAPIAASLIVQFDAVDAAALAAGRGRVVVNAVYPGCGWLMARHTSGDLPCHHVLRRDVTRWLAAVHAPAEPIDILLSGDCNDLQAHPPLTPRVLRWPIEPAGSAGGTLDFHHAGLRHDPPSGLLRMTDEHGRPVAPVYLGTTVPQPSWGAEFWLTALSWPYRIRWSPVPDPPPEKSGDIVSESRRQAGRVVLRRASWWMTADRLRRTWFHRTGAARLGDVAVDLAELGLPPRLFVHRDSRGRAPGRTAHKPLWVDTRNPFCLDAVERLTTGIDRLLLVEALPDVPGWPVLSGRAHVAELLAEVVWP